MEHRAVAVGEARVLHDLSLEIEKGEVVATVSSSGGESHRGRLLPRFWDPAAGRIAVDRRDIREVTCATCAPSSPW